MTFQAGSASLARALASLTRAVTSLERTVTNIDIEYFRSTFFERIVLHVLCVKPNAQAVLRLLTVVEVQ